MKKIILVMVALIVAQTSIAQQVNNVFALRTEKKHSLMLSLEFDPALFWGVSYNRNFDLQIGGFHRRIMGQIGWKTYQFNYNDLNLNVRTTLLNSRQKLNVLANFGIENKYLENTVHQANIYNWIVSLMPGFYAGKWYLGTEFMYKWLHAARFEHTPFYKAIFPEVKDGWYAYKNAYWNVSLNLGVKFSSRMDLDLRVGYRFTHDFQDYQPYLIPYFSDLALNYRF